MHLPVLDVTRSFDSVYAAILVENKGIRPTRGCLVSEVSAKDAQSHEAVGVSDGRVRLSKSLEVPASSKSIALAPVQSVAREFV
jgi:hypothetical protein